MSTSIGYIAVVCGGRYGEIVQRMLDEAEAEFLYGTMREVDPVGVMEVQRMLDALGPVKPVRHCNIEPARRQGKGERKRNRKHRWG